jgi:heptosyltransferase II
LKEKRWAVNNYVELAKKISNELKIKVVFVGNKTDGKLLDKYSEIFNNNIINCCGKFSLNSTAALLRKSKLFISNDSGLMHLAAANDVPVIAIFGPTIKEKNRPFSKNSIVISKNYDCQPCYKFNKKIFCKKFNCLNDITVEDIFNSIVKAQ